MDLFQALHIDQGSIVIHHNRFVVLLSSSAWAMGIWFLTLQDLLLCCLPILHAQLLLCVLSKADFVHVHSLQCPVNSHTRTLSPLLSSCCLTVFCRAKRPGKPKSSRLRKHSSLFSSTPYNSVPWVNGHWFLRNKQRFYLLRDII